MASEFESAAAEVEPLRAQLVELEGLADGFGRAMTTAFRRSVVDGKRLEDVLRSIALSLSSRALNAALAPIGQGVGSLFSGLLGSSLFGGLAARAGGRHRRNSAARGGRRRGAAELLSDAQRQVLPVRRVRRRSCRLPVGAAGGSE